MLDRLSRLGAVLLLPLLLASCVLAPGKFTSTLTINADRSFEFTYLGEIYALNPEDALKGLDQPDKGAAGAKPTAAAFRRAAAPQSDKDARTKADIEAKNRAIADALGKEEGYRKIEYLGGGKFMVDYAIRGTLTHSFVYPYNVDAEAVFPFIAVELRHGGIVRVTAPGYANDNSKMASASGMGMPTGDADLGSKLDGSFTLTTNAEIVSQNNEDGAKIVGGRKTISWKASPLTKTAPSAVLRLAPPAP